MLPSQTACAFQVGAISLYPQAHFGQEMVCAFLQPHLNHAGMMASEGPPGLDLHQDATQGQHFGKG